MQRVKRLSEEALQLAEKRKDKKLAAKGKGEKERYIHLMQSSEE